jgi:hypothetical protein
MANRAMYTCRECEGEINQATEVCPHCGAQLHLETPEPAGQKKKPGLAKTMLRYAIPIVAVWIFLWYILPARRGAVAVADAEARAVEALRATRAALADYAGARDGVYPATLDALPGESLAQVRQAAQAAQREGYRLEYSVVAESADGKSRHFVLLARPGNYGYRNFFTDESGVVRATPENRAATAQDTPI